MEEQIRWERRIENLFDAFCEPGYVCSWPVRAVISCCAEVWAYRRAYEHEVTESTSESDVLITFMRGLDVGHSDAFVDMDSSGALCTAAEAAHSPHLPLSSRTSRVSTAFVTCDARGGGGCERRHRSPAHRHDRTCTNAALGGAQVSLCSCGVLYGHCALWIWPNPQPTQSLALNPELTGRYEETNVVALMKDLKRSQCRIGDGQCVRALTSVSVSEADAKRLFTAACQRLENALWMRYS